MLFNDETEVVYNMLLRNGTRQHIVIMGKQKTHLLHIIADGTGAVMLYQQSVVQLLQATLCLNRQRYFTVLIFFDMIKVLNENAIS